MASAIGDEVECQNGSFYFSNNNEINLIFKHQLKSILFRFN